MTASQNEAHLIQLRKSADTAHRRYLTTLAEIDSKKNRLIELRQQLIDLGCPTLEDADTEINRLQGEIDRLVFEASELL